MMQMWKYPLLLMSESQVIEAPGWFEFRHFAIQDTKLTIWGEVHPSVKEMTKHTFRIVGTGSEIPQRWDYRGTLQDGGYVWHLYQKPAHLP